MISVDKEILKKWMADIVLPIVDEQKSKKSYFSGWFGGSSSAEPKQATNQQIETGTKDEFFDATDDVSTLPDSKEMGFELVFQVKQTVIVIGTILETKIKGIQLNGLNSLVHFKAPALSVDKFQCTITQ